MTPDTTFGNQLSKETATTHKITAMALGWLPGRMSWRFAVSPKFTTSFDDLDKRSITTAQIYADSTGTRTVEDSEDGYIGTFRTDVIKVPVTAEVRDVV